ncbi:hypothetical protein CWO91_16715 [Bradyrhizobium genosp. SA-3]|uniref:hypothetical protein n=1 Tax=Bradyrhizobium genosp. SA-3 TaxID=508868 RepID=UPI00102929C2|nr:hypothetical protein [Bradyrhizobium genosp. SA-3]RZN09670.1 hypothetical protein CWO91_16715 [Bradyrhizobium genosp. SA-3]
MKPSCNNCRWAIMRDYGYSNYTVEGTTFSCAQRLHPGGDFDRWYGRDERLEHAHKCEKYGEGEPLEFDVDGENYPNGLTPDQRATFELDITFQMLEGKVG